MTNKEYLGQAYRIDRQINVKLEQMISLRELASKTSSAVSDTPRNSSREIQPMENALVQIVDLAWEINNDLDRLVDLKKEVMGLINAIKNPEYRMLLELRYLCFWPWEHIAVEMGYSIQHLFRLHEKALKNITISKRGE